MKTDNSTDYLLDPGNFDSAKDARNHKNRELAKAVWFLLTTCAFAVICWALLIEPMATIGHLAMTCLAGLMAIFYLTITVAQAMNYWEDDLDGLLRPEDRWRF